MQESNSITNNASFSYFCNLITFSLVVVALCQTTLESSVDAALQQFAREKAGAK